MGWHFCILKKIKRGEIFMNNEILNTLKLFRFRHFLDTKLG